MSGTYTRYQKIFESLSTEYPDKKITNLSFGSTFELLIATILSAQSTDNQVNKITGKLFQIYSTPEEFAELSTEELAPLVKGCGLYKNKSKNIIETSKILVDNFNSQVPDKFEELMQLPGVGRKTANVILSVAFDRPVIPVDTHVFRVSRRLGLAGGNTPEVVEKELLDIAPVDTRQKLHYILIMHGRNTCRARNPQCSLCCVFNLCNFFRQNQNGR